MPGAGWVHATRALTATIASHHKHIPFESFEGVTPGRRSAALGWALLVLVLMMRRRMQDISVASEEAALPQPRHAGDGREEVEVVLSVFCRAGGSLVAGATAACGGAAALVAARHRRQGLREDEGVSEGVQRRSFSMMWWRNRRDGKGGEGLWWIRLVFGRGRGTALGL